MKVSDLVKFRNELVETLNKLSLDESVNNVCTQLDSVIVGNNIVNSVAIDKITKITDEFRSLLENSKNIIAKIPSIVTDIETIIDETAIIEFNESHEAKYSIRFKNADDAPYAIDAQVDKFIKSRLAHHANWHYPGLQFGCRYSGKLSSEVDNDIPILSQFTNLLVTSDPLYLCDFKETYTTNASAQFNEVYQKRLRTYTINDAGDLIQLPQAQFSFFLAWNLFNYASIAILEQYLVEIFKLLRMGGVVMFSYNNGDLYESTVLAETGAMSYIPKRHLITLCESIGFVVNLSYDKLNNCDAYTSSTPYISWIEVSKPGVLTTTKAHQVLGAIIEK